MSVVRTRVYRADYREPDFWAPHVELQFDLDVDKTIVSTRIHLTPNEAILREKRVLELDGEGLNLISVSVDGKCLPESDYSYSSGKLRLPAVQDSAVVDTVVEVVPRGNTSAMGLCPTHDGELFSQCESEAFRLFSFGLDRPDVMSTFDVVLRGNKKTYPVMLSNGHLVASGDLDDGRHWVRWQDPGPKPTYLFALFAGVLESEKRSFVTRSGRPVEIGLYAPARYMAMSRPALDFVLAALKWDEDVFDREYDLAVFNIGVMNGFAGAMENKGLNLFDLAWLAASDTNTTDEEYEYRMKSVAHEFFHHWSGDRVTVKNWFQVSLKEGLTRFRDQLFLADKTEYDSVRIKMARHLRANQFTEDDSAIAHAPVWDSYIEPRNVYTNTVYDKGQEAIFMLMAMLGRNRFQKVVSAYFDRYVDQAVTIEEFLKTFEDVGGLDLSQFRNWYYQAGVTDVQVTPEYDEQTKRLRLHLAQKTRPTSDQKEKKPHHIPFAVGLLDAEGRDMPTRLEGESQAQKAGTRVLAFRDKEQTFIFEDVEARPILSRLRGFSAPVRVNGEVSAEDLALLTLNDNDVFARWDAGQIFAQRTVLRLAADLRNGQRPNASRLFLDAFTSALTDQSLSARAMSDLLTLPDERTLGEASDPIDVDGIHAGRAILAKDIANHARESLFRVYDAASNLDVSDRSNDAVGRRRLKALALDYLTRLDDPEPRRVCLEILRGSENFTDQVNALNILAERECAEREEALAVFFHRHRDDHLALDRWYRAQAGAARDDTADAVDALMDSSKFEPLFSRLYALSESFFAYNRYGVNAPSGRGYEIFAKQILRIDALVPMISGWVMSRSDMPRWYKFDGRRQAGMKAALERIVNSPGVSPGLREHSAAALAADEKGAGA
jgi:aminopeptidase N